MFKNDIDRYTSDGLIHDNERLKELQALPLSKKIGITISRITEWYNHFNGNVYVSLSGGKDSTVLWDIVHKLFPDVPAIFSDTGLEYPEIREFAKNIATEVVKPKMGFVDIIREYGYPLISKEVSEAIYYARRNAPPVKRGGVETNGTSRNSTKLYQNGVSESKQSGHDWNSWGTDHYAVEQNGGAATHTHTHTHTDAGLTTYRKRSEFHGCRQDSYTAGELPEKDDDG